MSSGGLAAWLPAQGTGEFFGLSREVTPLMLAMELRALGSRPSWWSPVRRVRWDRRFIAITSWWLVRCSVVFE